MGIERIVIALAAAASLSCATAASQYEHSMQIPAGHDACSRDTNCILEYTSSPPSFVFDGATYDAVSADVLQIRSSSIRDAISGSRVRSVTYRTAGPEGRMFRIDYVDGAARIVELDTPHGGVSIILDENGEVHSIAAMPEVRAYGSRHEK